MGRSSTTQDCSPDFWKVQSTIVRNLLCRIEYDAADLFKWVVFRVTKEIGLTVEKQRKLVCAAETKLAQKVDMTARGGIGCVLALGDIESLGDPPAGMHQEDCALLDRLEDIDAIWLPSTFNLGALAAACPAQRMPYLPGLQVWRDTVRFTCYDKYDSSNLRFESVDLSRFLFRD